MIKRLLRILSYYAWWGLLVGAAVCLYQDDKSAAGALFFLWISIGITILVVHRVYRIIRWVVTGRD